MPRRLHRPTSPIILNSSITAGDACLLVGPGVENERMLDINQFREGKSGSAVQGRQQSAPVPNCI